MSVKFHPTRVQFLLRSALRLSNPIKSMSPPWCRAVFHARCSLQLLGRRFCSCVTIKRQPAFLWLWLFFSSRVYGLSFILPTKSAEATNLSVLSVLRTHRRNCRAALPSLNTSVSLSFTLRFTAILVLVRLTQHAVPQPHIPLETDVTEPRSNWCQPRRREPLDHFLASDHFNLFDCRVKSSHACVCRTQPATVPPLKRP